jgi:hypothetical protein
MNVSIYFTSIYKNKIAVRRNKNKPNSNLSSNVAVGDPIFERLIMKAFTWKSNYAVKYCDLHAEFTTLKGAQVFGNLLEIWFFNHASFSNVCGETRRLVSGGGRDARRILAALSIKEVNPPALKTARMRVKNANVVTNPKSSSYLTRTYERN